MAARSTRKKSVDPRRGGELRLSDEKSIERVERFRTVYAQALVVAASQPGFRERVERRFAQLSKANTSRARERLEAGKTRGGAARSPASILPVDASNPWSLALLQLALDQLMKQWAAGSAARDEPPRPLPTINKLTRTDVDPGDIVGIEGFDVDGDIFLLMPGSVITLVPATGTTAASAGDMGKAVTYVEFQVPQPTSLWDDFEGQVWVVRRDGSVTNHVTIRFRRAFEFWRASYERELKSFFGSPGVINDVAAATAQPLSPLTEVLPCEIEHSGEGWSELRAPMASGTLLAQGYHIGNAWFEYSKIRITFFVRCRRGDPPPQIAGLSNWYGPFANKPSPIQILFG